VKILGVIFDMDGLMLDTEPLYRIVWKRAAAACGYTITDEFYRGLVGRGRTVAERILAETVGPGFPMEKFRRLSREDEVRAFTFDPVATKPGLGELLEFVEARGWPNAVATSTERALAVPLLKRMGLLDRFVAVATGDEVTRGKPHPDLFLLAAERLGFAPGECLALEDSEAGVLAAAGAGMPVYMVPDLVQPSDEVARAATGIFESLHNVKKKLEEMRLPATPNGQQITLIKTCRLIGNPLIAADWQDLRTLDTDPLVMATLGGVRSVEQTAKWLRENLEHWDRHGFGIWIFRDAASNQIAGRAGLRRVEVEGAPEVELGYALASRHWGQGLGMEMGSAILHRGDPSVEMDRVIALIAASNLRSLRVAQKLDFHFERNAVWKDSVVTLHRRNANA